jgi:hypothetical protein
VKEEPTTAALELKRILAATNALVFNKRIPPKEAPQ